MSTTTPGAASTTHTITHQEVVTAFDLWEQEFRALPENFFTPEEAAKMETATLSEGRAISLFAYLRQAKGIEVPA